MTGETPSGPTEDAPPANPTGEVPQSADEPTGTDLSVTEAESYIAADSARPVTEFPASPPPTKVSAEDGGFNALWSMLNRSLFFDYFAHVADRKFVDPDPRVRVQKHRSDHPRWYWFAVVADTVVKIATVVIFVGVATALAIKIIA